MFLVIRKIIFQINFYAIYNTSCCTIKCYLELVIPHSYVLGRALTCCIACYASLDSRLRVWFTAESFYFSQKFLKGDVQYKLFTMYSRAHCQWQGVGIGSPVAGVLYEPFSQLTSLSGVAVHARQST